MSPDVVGLEVELEDGFDVDDWPETGLIRRRNWTAAASRHEKRPALKVMTFWGRGKRCRSQGLVCVIALRKHYSADPLYSDPANETW